MMSFREQRYYFIKERAPRLLETRLSWQSTMAVSQPCFLLLGCLLTFAHAVSEAAEGRDDMLEFQFHHVHIGPGVCAALKLCHEKACLFFQSLDLEINKDKIIWLLVFIFLVMSSSLQPPWTVVCQSFLLMGFSRQEGWWLPFPPRGIFATQGSNPGLSNWAGTFFTIQLIWEAL